MPAQLTMPNTAPALADEWRRAIGEIESLIARVIASDLSPREKADRCAGLRGLLAIARRREAEVDPFGGPLDEVLT